jgi:hypothetical protein
MNKHNSTGTLRHSETKQFAADLRDHLERFGLRSPATARNSTKLSTRIHIRSDRFTGAAKSPPQMLAIDSTMEAPMGKTFALFSTDPIVRRRLREAHAARNAYLRSLFGALFGRCRDLVMRAQHDDHAVTAEVSPVRVHGRADRP